MKKICFFNHKGGTGKTTMAINSAIFLSKLEFKVLLLDMDSQLDSTGFFNILENDINDNNLYKILIKHLELEDNIIEINNKLHVLPSTSRNNFEDLNSFLNTKSKTFLENRLNTNNYDFVIIDCSPTSNSVNMHILNYVDNIVLVTLPEYLGIKGIVNVYKFINENIKEDKVKNIIINRIKNNKEHKEIINMLNDIFKNKNILEIKDTISITRQSRTQQSFLDLNNTEIVSQFLDFVKEIINNG